MDITLHGLLPGRIYGVQARATSPNGVSEWTPSFRLETDTDQLAPKPVTNLLTYMEQGNLRVTWTPPAENTNNTPLQDLKDYRVSIRPLPDNPAHPTRYLFVETTSATFPKEINVAAWGSYYPELSVTVQARDHAGNLSDPVVSTKMKAKPNPPVLTYWKPVKSAFAAAWTSPTQNIDGSPLTDLDGFEVSVIYNGTETKKFIVRANTFDFSYEANKAAFGTARTPLTIEVRARDSVGQLSSPAILSASNPPPTAVTAVTGTALLDSIRVTWNESADDDIVAYRIYSHSAATGAGILHGTISAPAKEYIHQTVAYASDHYLYIVSVDEFGLTAESGRTGAIRPKSPFTVDTTIPAATTLTATTASRPVTEPAAVNLSWPAVSDTDLAGYHIRYSENVTPRVWQFIDVIDKTATSQVVTNLRSATAYRFQIRSYDQSVNTSAWSAETSGTSSTSNVIPSDIATTIQIITGGVLRSANYVEGTPTVTGTGWMLSPSLLNLESGRVNARVISAGELRSNLNITDAAKGVVGQPLWSLNLDGNMSINDAQVRGKIVVGGPSDTAAQKASTSIASSNYGGSGAQWAIKGDGTFDIKSGTGSRVQLSSSGLEAWSGTTQTFNLTNAGNLSLVGNITATGGSITGDLTVSARLTGGTIAGANIYGSVYSSNENQGLNQIRIGPNESVYGGTGPAVTFGIPSSGSGDRPYLRYDSGTDNLAIANPNGTTFSSIELAADGKTRFYHRDEFNTNSEGLRLPAMVVDSTGATLYEHLTFSRATRQQINLYNDDYGIGVQDNTQYYRSNYQYAWFQGGAHSNVMSDPGPGGVSLMRLDNNGNLYLKGNIVVGSVTGDAGATFDDSNLVHKTFMETISGQKTFTGGILKNGFVVMGQDESDARYYQRPLVYSKTEADGRFSLLTDVGTTVVAGTSYGLTSTAGTGNLWARATHSHGTPPAQVITGGTAISAVASGVNYTINNTGVTSLAVTNNASVNASTGGVTITNSLTPTFTTVTTTGALTVGAGASITGNLSFTGTLTAGSVPWARITDGPPAWTEASTPGTLAVRTSAGDLQARLFRSEYTIATTSPNFFMVSHVAGGAGTDNYIRPATAATVANRMATEGLAWASHKYHPFANNQYFYDNYEQGNFLRLFTENSSFSTTRFQSIYNVEYWDGAAWVAWVGGDALIRNLLDGSENTYAQIDHTHRQFRFTLPSGGGYPTLALYFLQSSWSGIAYPSMTLTIEEATSLAGVYTQKDQAIFNSTTTGGNWGTHLKTTSALHNGASHRRFTINITDWVDSGTYTTVPLKRFELLSNYQGGSLLPYTWDYYKNITSPARITAKEFYATEEFYGVRGTAANVSYGFSDNGNTGMWSPAVDQLGFSTGGTNRITLTTTAETHTLPTTFSGLITANGNISLESSSGDKWISTWTNGDSNWRIGMSANVAASFTRKYATSHVQYITYSTNATQGFAVGNKGGNSSLEIRGDHKAYFRGETEVQNVLKITRTDGTSAFTFDPNGGATASGTFSIPNESLSGEALIDGTVLYDKLSLPAQWLTALAQQAATSSGLDQQQTINVVDFAVAPETFIAGTINADSLNLGTAGRLWTGLVGATATSGTRLTLQGSGIDADRGIFAFVKTSIDPDPYAETRTIQLRADGTFALRSINTTNYVNFDSDKFEMFQGGVRKVYIGASGEAEFAGKVTAGSGSIGGWEIESDRLRSTNATVVLSPTTGIQLGTTSDPLLAEFTVSPSGAQKATNADISGTINANDGTIGGWNAANGNLSSGTTMVLSPTTGIMLGTTGVFSTSEFSVTPAGVLTASSGKIGGWSIDSSKIQTAGATTGSIRLNSTGTIHAYANNDYTGTLFAINPTHGTYLAYAYDATNGYFFRVNRDGSGIYAKGEIEATSGLIGGWNIKGDRIVSQEGTAGETGLYGAGTSANTAMWAGGPSSTAPFRVLHNGTLTASGVDISGNITASTLSVTGNSNLHGWNLYANHLWSGSTNATRVALHTTLGFYAGATSASAAPIQITPAGLFRSGPSGATRLEIDGDTITFFNVTNGVQKASTIQSYSDGGISIKGGGFLDFGSPSGPNVRVASLNEIELSANNLYIHGTVANSIGARSDMVANTLALRDASGDIDARLFKMTYTSNNTSIAHFATLQATGTSNNYIRPSTIASVASALASQSALVANHFGATRLGSGRQAYTSTTGSVKTGTFTWGAAFSILPDCLTGLETSSDASGRATSVSTTSVGWRVYSAGALAAGTMNFMGVI